MNNEKEPREMLIEIRESTGMNRRQFCAFFEIPYTTESDWEHGNRRVPKYFLRLLEYYVRLEDLKKGKDKENGRKAHE